MERLMSFMSLMKFFGFGFFIAFISSIISHRIGYKRGYMDGYNDGYDEAENTNIYSDID